MRRKRDRVLGVLAEAGVMGMPVLTIGKALKRRSWRTTGLFATMYRLADEGLVESHWVQEPGARLPRRYYRITERGRHGRIA